VKTSIKIFLLVVCQALSPLLAAKDKVISLESNTIGNKEQPSISYSLPWKAPEGPEKLYRNINTFNKKILNTIDRDVMIRSIEFYDELNLENAPDSK